jgi:4-hydroxybenzoate polyprenyltransferase
MAASWALVRAAHPGPCLVITAIITALAGKAGARPAILALLAFAVLASQFSVGWSNDAFDAAHDRAAGRSDKPIAAGQLTRRAVAVAAGVAVVVGPAAGFLVGTRTGALNLLMTAAAWAYNAGLKSTLWSGVMYVVGFAPVPAVAASAAHAATNWLAVAAAGTLGLGGHFTNVLADLDADLATGVRGLPQRIAAAAGPTAVRIVGLVLLVGASVMAAFAGIGNFRVTRLGAPALIGLAVVAGLAVVGLVGRGRAPFRAALGIALVDVALLVLAG